MKQGVIVSHFGVAVCIEEAATKTRVILRTKRKSGLVVGDEVCFDDQIRHLSPRKNILTRKTESGIQAIAANLDALGIVITCVPKSPQTFIDLAVVAARNQGIRPFLVVNKADLPEYEEYKALLDKIFSPYMPVLSTSTRSQAGLKELNTFLNQSGRSLFIGVSGAGKSSLVNALIPGANLDVGELGPEHSHGKHATTVSSLHHVDGGGELIDTPGIRDMKIASVQPENLARLFVGFEQWLKNPCRFRNCLHEHEPGCHIREAVREKKIDSSRYAIYQELLKDLKESHGHKN